MTLLEQFEQGSIRALSRIISHVENRNDGYLDLASGRKPKPLFVVGPGWSQLLATVAKAVDTSPEPIVVAANSREVIAALHEHLALES